MSHFRSSDIRKLLLSNLSWDDLLKALGIVDIVVNEIDDRLGRTDTYLILENRTFYRMRFSPRLLDEYRIDWGNFLQLENHSREAIVDALLEDRDGRRIGMMPIQFVQKNFDEYLAGRTSAMSSEHSEDGEISRLTINQIVEPTEAGKPLNEARFEEPHTPLN